MPASCHNGPPYEYGSGEGNVYMRKLVKIASIWHSFQYHHHYVIANDCLCSEMKERINRKIDYHLTKIRQLEALK